MIPVEATKEQIEWWAERDGSEGEKVTIGGPAEGPDVIPCPTLVTRGVDLGDGYIGNLFHVALQLDEIEVAALTQGGTLWLTTFGSLPIHLVEVQRKD